MNKYKAQLIEFCETGNVEFLLVPVDKKGVFIKVYFDHSLIPESMMENDYAIVEISENQVLKNTVITNAFIILDDNPDMTYFITENPFKELSNSAFFKEL